MLKDDLGRVLITQRPPGKPQAGYWEFPGGKIESGEVPGAALERELHEELGVIVESAHPLIRLNHTYAERRVALEVFRVHRFRGEVHAREGQALAWVLPAELSGWNLLPADAPIVVAVRLPPLMLVTPAPGRADGLFLDRLEGVLDCGVELVQLRAPERSRPEYRSLAGKVIEVCRRRGARIVLNAEPGLARALGADGVHLRSARLLSLSGRPLPPSFLVGASCHNATEVRHAEACRLDYLVLGPVRKTASHPGSAVLGWPGFAALGALATLPLYAIGGMRTTDLEQVRDLGGHGVAAMRGLWKNQLSVSS